MSSPTKTTPPVVDRNPSSSNNNVSRFGNGEDKQDSVSKLVHHLPMPGLSGAPNSSVGKLLKGPIDADGNLKDASLTVGIKLDLEAEVHLTARIRGDILVGLY